MQIVYGNVNHIRNALIGEYREKKFLKSPSGVLTVDLSPACFVSDDDHIIGLPNEDYQDRELAWYLSKSRNINDIPGGPPEIWKRVASPEGLINSNYGWCIFSEENGDQFTKCARELLRDPTSRRAIMIYTRPTMHEDQKTDGMQDFMCTNTVQYFVRNGFVSCVVSMRSNDAWAGYRNDRHWQFYVLQSMAESTGNKIGKIYWHAGSLHVYQNQFYLLHHLAETGNTSITKEKFREFYKGFPEEYIG